MEGIKLSRSEYRDKVYACWLGKNIGGTLGAPYEGRKETHSLTYYDPLPREASANDDLDFQLVWLRMLLERGVEPTLEDFVDYWIEHLSPYPWNEYGFCRRNLGRGLRPPISGSYENYFVDEMGSPIRSEIWACVAPGDPGLAAQLAWMDSALDHAGGEGTFGEMFWAAVESAAFVHRDPHQLIQVGLSMIPVWSRIYRVIREAESSYRRGLSWSEARERVLRCFGHNQPCHAPQNHGFTVIGWLYGKDYGDKLCQAVNCGYDTDCTGATLGSLLGILGGTAGIPREWREPIGDTIVLHPFTRRLKAPGTVGELTDLTAKAAERMVSARSDSVEFSRETRLPRDLISLLSRNMRALEALSHDPQSAISYVEGFEVALHYGGEPVVRPGIEKEVGVSVRHQGKLVEAEVTLVAPGGWEVREAPTRLGQRRFTLRGEIPGSSETIRVKAGVRGRVLEASFVFLGPEEAEHFPCGDNVPTCPKCHARKEDCICDGQ